MKDDFNTGIWTIGCLTICAVAWVLFDMVLGVFR
jgi:hypothetical protein